MFREALADVEVAGVAHPGGRHAWCRCSARRTATSGASPTPTASTSTRNPQGHVGFGFGKHFCLGASLARLEAKVALEALVPELLHMQRGEARVAAHRLLPGARPEPAGAAEGRLSEAAPPAPRFSASFWTYLASRFCAATAMTLLRSAVYWHVFALTRSEAALGAIGLVQFVPALALTLVGGMAADAYDRRTRDAPRAAALSGEREPAVLGDLAGHDQRAAALRGGVRERGVPSPSTAPRARPSCRPGVARGLPARGHLLARPRRRSPSPPARRSAAS